MKEIMNRVKELVREHAPRKQQGQADSDTQVSSVPENWDMSSDDALRAPIVSGYK